MGCCNKRYNRSWSYIRHNWWIWKSGEKGLSFAQNLVQGAKVGARFDLLDKDSQDDNISGLPKERFPWLDTPLATQETDGPLMKTLKNVTEGMVIGGVFDATLMGIARNFPKDENC